VQLPGRGSRIHEPPFSELSPLVEAAAAALQPHFDRPFAFFGHSMGAIIAFEIARLLRRTHREEPTRLIVSGRRAPHVPSDEPPTYNLPDDEFVEELRRLNGTPRQVLEHPELMQLMLPLVRADFAVTQTYVHKEEPPLRCPFTVFGGIEDTDAGGESLSRWCELTKGACSVKIFEGGHFFINTSEARLLQVLKQELLRHELP
jgi:medium-chain acyl-[acyl-carrier-protein] hydrolase